MTAAITNHQLGSLTIERCRALLADKDNTTSPRTQTFSRAWAGLRYEERAALLMLAGIVGEPGRFRRWQALTGRQRAAVVTAMAMMRERLGAIASAIQAAQADALAVLTRDAAGLKSSPRLVA